MPFENYKSQDRRQKGLPQIFNDWVMRSECSHAIGRGRRLGIRSEREGNKRIYSGDLDYFKSTLVCSMFLGDRFSIFLLDLV